MSKKQKEIFLDFEADNWYSRNKDLLENRNVEEDFLLLEILQLQRQLNLETWSILEIGCGNAKRLIELKKSGNQVFGVDPSKNAIQNALENGIDAKIGTADSLPFDDNKFDVIVFGFCLYLCDRDDLFKIASEAHRVLKNNGYLFILDFYSKNELENDYHHYKGLKSYKMDYSKLFEWHPYYTLIKKIVGSHREFLPTDDKNELISVSLLRKKN